MSKIQDALRRIRAQESWSSQNNEKYDDSTAKLKQLGQVVADSSEVGASAEANDGQVAPKELIKIDDDALRVQGYLAPRAQERQLEEQYRILKRPILQNVFGQEGLQEESANLLMITSALPGDGKTFNCINLALSMARERDVGVLFVDADVARPHASRLLGVSDRQGLTDLLVDETLRTNDLVLPTSLPSLSILPAGQPNQQSTELLASKRMKKLVGDLANAVANRIVIFDSPPLLVTSESRVLSGYMGQIAMVVCAGRTSRHAVIEALDSIDSSKAVNLILNQATKGVGAGGYATYQYGHGPGGDA